MTLTTLPTTAPAGYYGTRGWTTERKIGQLLKPYLLPDSSEQDNAFENGTQVLSSYERFSGISTEVAVKLLEILPLRNLSDRQNFSPTCEQMLQAKVNHPEAVELIGYAVGPQRADERVTFEGMIFTTPNDYHWEPYHNDSCQCTEVWADAQKSLNLSSALDRPDEVIKLADNGSEGYQWRLWWD